MKKIFKAGIISAATVATLAVPATAFASSSNAGGNSTAWSAQYYNPSGNALGGPQPVGIAPDAASVPLSSSYLATVTTNQKADVGNLLGKTVTVTIDPSQLQNVQFQGEAGSGMTNVSVRFYFQGGANGDVSGTGYYTQSWWSNPVSVDLTAKTSQIISVPISDTGGWSDWNGQANTSYPAGFDQAASHIRSMGLSFGGGYFFENGVSGTGNLGVSGFSVTP